MDPVRQPSGQFEYHDSDADIAKMIYKTAQSVKHAFIYLYRGIQRLVNIFFYILLFLLRNIIWIILGTALGLGYGLYQLNKNGSKFQSQMIVKANFNSIRSLYNTIDYLNAIINTGRKDELAGIFNISPAEAAQIDGFSIEPVESEVIKAEMYKNLFIENRHGDPGKMDTVWLRTLNYKDFKEKLTRFDYPYQEISGIATNPVIFAKLQDGIIDQISHIPLLLQSKQKQDVTNKDEEKVIRGAISGIDSLRLAYNQRLIIGHGSTESNQLTLMQTTPETKTPELDLYDKLLDLQDELKKLGQRSVEENNILSVYSPFNPVGQKVSFLKQSVVKYGIWGFTLSVALLFVLAVSRNLVKMEKKKKLA
ncbi:MAG: hypothetical protein H0W12_10945 [Chitinophagaceae bacterium]|nr:hypothetical protein [Chitinophagaceae bacterium]